MITERLALQDRLLETFKRRDDLMAFRQSTASMILERESSNWGGMSIHLFRSLQNRRWTAFPQALSTLFENKGISGEIINEFKLKTAYYAARHNIPALLNGQIMYHFFFDTFKQFYNQNYPSDYFTSYFLFDVFNSAYLNKTINMLKKEGLLRIR